MDLSQPEPSRKRRRKIWACSECRRRKLQCDRATPACGRCQKTGLAGVCQYADALDRAVIVTGDVSIRRPEPVTPVEQRNIVHRSSEPHDDFERCDALLSSRIAQLEKKIKCLEEKIITGPTSQKTISPSEPYSTPLESGGNLDALYPSVGNNLRIRFAGNTSPGTLARFIAELEVFIKDLFATCPILEDIRRGISQLQHDAQRAAFNGPRPSHATLVELFSTKEEMDRNIDTYMDTFDQVYHILHKPTFEEDYARMWVDPTAVDTRQVILTLLIVAIAHYSTAPTGLTCATAGFLPREKATHIIDICEDWLRSRVQKYEEIIDFQIAFLLLVGRQLGAKWYKRTWANAGNHLRICMCAGLNRCINVLNSHHGIIIRELRKRLWVAAAEFELQASFEQGMCATPWPQQSDRIIPLNIFDDSLQQGMQEEILGEHTPASFLSGTSRSLHLRHHLNNALNSTARPLSFDQTKEYADRIHHSLHQIPEETSSHSVAVRALLSLNLQQYLLALFARQLQESTSPTEKDFSRISLIETASKMVHQHKKALKSGSQIVEALYGDHLRIALSVCYAFIKADPQSDCAITAALEEQSLNIVDEIFEMASAKVKHFGADRPHFWLIAASIGVMRSKTDPGGRESHIQALVNQLARPYSDMLLQQRLHESTALENAETNVHNENLADGQFDVLADQMLFQWGSNVSDWTGNDWLFGNDNIF